MQTDAVKGKNAIHPGRKVALEIAGIIVSIFFLMPFAIVILNSMRTNGEIINHPYGSYQMSLDSSTNVADSPYAEHVALSASISASVFSIICFVSIILLLCGKDTNIF